MTLDINLIFNTKVNTLSVMDLQTNIDKFPGKTKIINSLIDNFKNNKIEQRYFQNNFNLICKCPFINILNQDLARFIKDFVFEFNDKQLKYILHEIYQHFDSKLEKIENENKFDLNWYSFDTLDYYWASNTLKKVQEEKRKLNKIILLRLSEV